MRQEIVKKVEKEGKWEISVNLAFKIAVGLKISVDLHKVKFSLELLCFGIDGFWNWKKK